MFYYKFTLYALIKMFVCKRVGMLYTDTDSFCFHYFVKELAKEINLNYYFRDEFYLNEISYGYLFYFGRKTAN